MFEFQKKDTYGEFNFYTFYILDADYEKVGTIGISIGNGRHDAGIIFEKDIKILDTYQYIEDLRELLDNDLIQLDEPHERIILSEITHK